MRGNRTRHSLTIRIFHWFNMSAIILLIASGFYIHAPRIFNIFDNMGSARKIHFIFMYIIVFSVIGRIYYALATKDKKNLAFTREDLRNLIPMMKYYLFITNIHPIRNPKYNSGQKLIYCSWVILLLIQFVTGLTLYIPQKLYTIAYFLGGFGVVKDIHYLVTWVYVLTIALHIYLDISEGKAVVKSMITGKGE